MRFFTRIIDLQKKYKSLIESILSLSFLQLANMILPLITLPYLVKVLGVNNYGIYVFAYSVSNYFATIIDYGFKLTGTRDVALNRKDPKVLSAIISKILYSKALLAIVSLLILSTTIPLFDKYNESYLVFYFSFLVVLFTSFFPDWFFQGIEKNEVYNDLKSLFQVSFHHCNIHIYQIASRLYICSADWCNWWVGGYGWRMVDYTRSDETEFYKTTNSWYCQNN